MAVKVAVKKINGGLYPATERDEEQLGKIPQGDYLTMTFKKMRNPKQHRLYWGLLKTVYDNLPHEFDGRYMNIDAFHREVKYLAGAVETFQPLDGAHIVSVKSIAFGQMPQEEFEDFFRRALDVIASYFMPDVHELPEAAKWIDEVV